MVSGFDEGLANLTLNVFIEKNRYIPVQLASESRFNDSVGQLESLHTHPFILFDTHTDRIL
jgi:hypothetical protein